ncbi:MAG TPA: aminotransferase class V-fold PLP-dependent enzyme [Amnibacterium sp.]|jgi:kynureninase|nr:aminotransferase class V-fold PLP-dependent enzyme [Amnibacterium sp.]
MTDRLARRAAELDAADPLAPLRDRFEPAEGVVAYLDGNSLGRPVVGTAERLAAFVREEWGARLIRAWDEGWLAEPERLGDEIGRVALGAAPGQTLVGDSTTVLLYKAARAALAARPGRTEIVLDAAEFPTGRYLLAGIAAELGHRLVVLEPPVDGGITPAMVGAAVGSRTALVLLSHVAFRSAYITDAAEITRITHEAGALVLWDLSHSTGAVPVELDEWDADLAAGCGYKYLNGGPGAPAFLYVASRLQAELRQPIQGWLGTADPFLMGERYEPAAGVRRFTSGTPPILGMLPIADTLALIDEAGMPAVRAKSVALTGFAIEVADALLAPAGVRLESPRDPSRRGSHIMLAHADFAGLLDPLWRRGVVPDFRRPDGLRIGLAPLSTSFQEVLAGLSAVQKELVGG